MLSDRFIRTLPPGTPLEDVHIVQCTAAVQTDELTNAERLVVAAVADKASVPLIGADGKPTIMKVAAWMAHEGINQNRQGFVKEELASIAPSLFRAPNFGVLDWNHSAVALFSDEPKVIGIWYNAEFAFDEKAQKWGILATGMLFSWLFQDHADSLLADQQRLGSMRFSMACLTSAKETGVDAQGPYMILHNPVFFTVSALDVKPADPAALGKGDETPDVSIDTIRQRLIAVAHSTPWQNMQAAQQTPASPKGAKMDEIVEQLTNARVKAETDLALLTEKYSIAESAITTKTGEIETLTAELVTIRKTVDDQKDLEAKYAELETTRNALQAEKDLIDGKVIVLEAKITELQVIADEVIEAKATVAKAEVLAARLNALPASYRAAHEAREEDKRKVVEARWTAMNDEEFASVVEDITSAIGSTDMRVSFLDRTIAEGNTLPVVGSSVKEFNFARYLRN